MEYNFRYSITEDEFTEYNTYTVWFAPWHKKKRFLFALRQFVYLLIVVFVTSYFLSKSRPQREEHTVLKVLAGFAIALLITALVFYQVPFGVKSRAKKLIRKEENSHILNEQDLEITDIGITNKDKISTTQHNWNSIVKYAITKDFIYLYLNSIQAYIIPKRLFTSVKEITYFEKFIAEKTPLSSSFRSIGI